MDFVVFPRLVQDQTTKSTLRGEAVVVAYAATYAIEQRLCTELSVLRCFSTLPVSTPS